VLPDRLELQEVDDLFDELAVDDLLPLRRSPVEERGEHVVSHVHVTAERQVLEHGHVPEELDVLK
jgi:hypothetical protein